MCIQERLLDRAIIQLRRNGFLYFYLKQSDDLPPYTSDVEAISNFALTRFASPATYRVNVHQGKYQQGRVDNVCDQDGKVDDKIALHALMYNRYS